MEGSSVVDDERRARAEETRDGEVRCWWIKQRLWRAVEASAKMDGSSRSCAGEVELGFRRGRRSRFKEEERRMVAVPSRDSDVRMSG
jgi:hypothetical protein